jgi:hypothetical protein
MLWRLEATGLFTFPAVAAGVYNLEVKATGFKPLSLSGITVITSERHALGSLTLQVGDVCQSVEVTAEAAALQLASGERSGLVTGVQVNDLALKGRNDIALMQTITGVVDTVTSRDATSNTAGAGVYINGARDNTKNITVDGIAAMDSGSNGSLTSIGTRRSTPMTSLPIEPARRGCPIVTELPGARSAVLFTSRGCSIPQRTSCFSSDRRSSPGSNRTRGPCL